MESQEKHFGVLHMGGGGVVVRLTEVKTKDCLQMPSV